ncbi:predicted protein [Uncinocarpus reesii 1704]|uniref:Uncharacterized protein n=1 Tax=Uncinocarpus reesii (strain UAMH 1704) TaxID=336963 RepID=C4JM12_UNCRE|nr:uncharacterized protein UREG_03870 [Uncinocarpus reesii 1704]EEP79024.1 predicted protein [Uncinocarpus reesii 1704]
MEARSDQFSVLSNNGHPVSSTHTPQQWMNQPFILRSGHRARRFDPSVDQPTLAQRTAAFRQLNRVPRPPQRIRRQTTTLGSCSPLPSQPVVVTTYIAETETRGTMSRRDSRSEHGPPAKLPRVQDFGIDGILRAIEPDIQTTLDAIAEICGRSKLSLANEYGSHRPPLGEIRAPARLADHGLLAVEETSSSNERLAGDNVIIVGDDISTVDGREPYSRYGLLENMQPNIGSLDYPNTVAPWAESDTQPTTLRGHLPSTGESRSQSQSRSSRGTKTRPSSFPWALVGKSANHGNRANRQSIQTQPLISEVYLDAEAGGTARLSTETDWPFALPNHSDEEKSVLKLAAERLSIVTDIRGLLGWFKHARQQRGSGEDGACPTAERKLRELLQKQDTQLLSRDGDNRVLHDEGA